MFYLFTRACVHSSFSDWIGTNVDKIETQSSLVYFPMPRTCTDDVMPNYYLLAVIKTRWIFFNLSHILLQFGSKKITIVLH